MKTKTKKQTGFLLSQVANTSQTSVDNTLLCVVYKSDLANHRFAQHGNKKVEDASIWDQAWFAHYE